MVGLHAGFLGDPVMIGTRRNPLFPGTEEELHVTVCEYLRLKYPGILFRTDFAAGTYLHKRQAGMNKKVQAGRAWPDLFIAHAKFNHRVAPTAAVFYGLFIELKREGTKLYLKDGVTMVSNEHFREQAACLEELRGRGYKAEFAVGIDQAVKLLDEYLT